MFVFISVSLVVLVVLIALSLVFLFMRKRDTKIDRGDLRFIRMWFGLIEREAGFAEGRNGRKKTAARALALLMHVPATEWTIVLLNITIPAEKAGHLPKPLEKGSPEYIELTWAVYDWWCYVNHGRFDEDSIAERGRIAFDSGRY